MSIISNRGHSSGKVSQNIKFLYNVAMVMEVWGEEMYNLSNFSRISNNINNNNNNNNINIS